MKKPTDIDKVKIIESTNSSIIPPIGFLEIEQGNGGYGDCYGLYWELGKEEQEPIVCEYEHEEFQLSPQFPKLSKFIEWYQETDGQEANTINLNDRDFFMNLYLKSKVLARKNETEEAIERLEQSVKLFGEFSDSWALLGEQYYKVDNRSKAIESLFNAITSNWMFGLPSKKVIEMYSSIEMDNNSDTSPLFKYRKELLSSGDLSKPKVVNYPILKDVAYEFEQQGNYRAALLLSQNYAYLLSLEKDEIQVENKFNQNEWLNSFKDKLKIHFPKRIK
jgi:tetratricopeptide (TPR) repeat protein